MSLPPPRMFRPPPSESPPLLGDGEGLGLGDGDGAAAAGAAAFSAILIGRNLSDGVGSFQVKTMMNSVRGFTLTVPLAVSPVAGGGTVPVPGPGGPPPPGDIPSGR